MNTITISLSEKMYNEVQETLRKELKKSGNNRKGYTREFEYEESHAKLI